ncbi:MAG: MerR family transcriptional regulator [Flavobacteriales bacterium]
MIKDTFTIKSLENLTGIKVPTIRMWEKRYGILTPTRSKTGIREYTIDELSLMLNIAFLNNHGWKISKIARLSQKEIHASVNSLVLQKSNAHFDLEQFIITMLTFNENEFNSIFKKLMKERSFENIFEQIFIPLLERVGILWQTNTIEIIHEHFITSLISQKLINQIENQKIVEDEDQKRYILFLPKNEIHELGLRYIQYKLIKANKLTVYLGNHTELAHLLRFGNNPQIELIANLTVNPDNKSLGQYLESLKLFVDKTNLIIHLLGIQFNIHKVSRSPHKNINIYSLPEQLMEQINLHE